VIIETTINLMRWIGTARGGGATRGSGTSGQEAEAPENVRQRHRRTRGDGAGEHEVKTPVDKRGRCAGRGEAVAGYEAEAAR